MSEYSIHHQRAACCLSHRTVYIMRCTCDDRPNSYITDQAGRTCANFNRHRFNCNLNPLWVAAGYCRKSCAAAGYSYSDGCCDEERPPPLAPPALVLVVQGCSGSSFVWRTLIHDLLPLHGVTPYQQYARHTWD